MINDNIQIGNKIDMVLISSSDKSVKVIKPKRLVSQLLEFGIDNKAKIAMPMDGSKMVLLEIGDIYEMCFYTSKGLYRCKGKITNRFKDKKIYMIEIEFLTFLKKYQRRDYYRLDVTIPIQFRIIEATEKLYNKKLENNDFVSQDEKEQFEREINKLKKYSNGKIVDISGGGLRFSSLVEIKKEDLLEIIFRFSYNDKMVSAKLNVIEVLNIRTPEYGYEIRGSYFNMEKKDREEIVKFIYWEQINRMKKG